MRTSIYLDANSPEKCSVADTWSSACSGTVKHTRCNVNYSAWL